MERLRGSIFLRLALFGGGATEETLKARTSKIMFCESVPKIWHKSAALRHLLGPTLQFSLEDNVRRKPYFVSSVPHVSKPGRLVGLNYQQLRLQADFRYSCRLSGPEVLLEAHQAAPASRANLVNQWYFCASICDFQILCFIFALHLQLRFGPYQG